MYRFIGLIPKQPARHKSQGMKHLGSCRLFSIHRLSSMIANGPEFLFSGRLSQYLCLGVMLDWFEHGLSCNMTSSCRGPKSSALCAGHPKTCPRPHKQPRTMKPCSPKAEHPCQKKKQHKAPPNMRKQNTQP